MKTEAFKQFLADSQGQKELPLILAKTSEEFEVFSSKLTEEGFVGSDNIFSVINHLEKYPKIYLVINEKSVKDVYDLALQYPTGQIQIQNHENLSEKSFSPDYNKYSIILLTTDELLNHVKKQNFDFLPIVGMVYKES